MIDMPNFEKAWDYENGFYLTCDTTRISKIIAHWELYRMALNIPGVVVECGVFKGASFNRFAAFRDIPGNAFSKKIIGFDTFDQFPETAFVDDIPKRRQLIEASGSTSISVDQLQQTLENKNCHQNIELVPGDICNTVPEYVARHPELKISLLNLDTDIYEPAVTILEHLYPRIVQGGILIIDDYGTFPGETKAIDEYMSAHNPNVKIRKFPFCMTPCYVVVE